MVVLLGAAAALALAASAASASELVYRPINPSLGGDPLNGNWLLSQATAQTAGGGSAGFTIDFPDFGGIPQPTEPTDPTQLPTVPVTGN
jgi:hypothetical protein